MPILALYRPIAGAVAVVCVAAVVLRAAFNTTFCLSFLLAVLVNDNIFALSFLACGISCSSSQDGKNCFWASNLLVSSLLVPGVGGDASFVVMSTPPFNQLCVNRGLQVPFLELLARGLVIKNPIINSDSVLEASVACSSMRHMLRGAVASLRHLLARASCPACRNDHKSLRPTLGLLRLQLFSQRRFVAPNATFAFGQHLGGCQLSVCTAPERDNNAGWVRVLLHYALHELQNVGTVDFVGPPARPWDRRGATRGSTTVAMLESSFSNLVALRSQRNH